MACRLCEEDKPLQNSHVVPEFFYKPSYDEKHRIYARISGKLAHMPPLQKGLREPLLCWDCEQKLSPYEKYNREILYGGVEITGSRKPNKIEFIGLNYKRVRVFYLSLLWRMSIAGHRFWKDVDLGRHEEKVREMVRWHLYTTRPDMQGISRFNDKVLERFLYHIEAMGMSELQEVEVVSVTPDFRYDLGQRLSPARRIGEYSAVEPSKAAETFSWYFAHGIDPEQYAALKILGMHSAERGG